MKQELLTLPEHMSSHPFVVGSCCSICGLLYV